MGLAARKMLCITMKWNSEPNILSEWLPT